MKNKILMVFIAFGVFCFFVSNAHAISLVNGGAEEGTLNGWTTSGYTAVNNPTQAQSGDYYFALSSGSDASWLKQVGTAGLTTGDTFELSGYCKTDAYDWGTAKISFYDSANNYLGGDTSGNIGNTYLNWYSFNISSIVPQYAASWEVMFTAHKNPAYGSVTNVDWDSLSLVSTQHSVPEPVTILLLVTGLFCLAGFKRRFIK